MKKIWIAFFAAVVACMATAKTIAWYRFDEKDIGSSPSSGTYEIYNAVNRDLFPARALQHAGKAYDYSSSTTYLPIYKGAFPEGEKFVNPETGETLTNTKGLYFHYSGNDANGNGSIVLIDNDARLSPKNLTIECFVKFDPNFRWGTTWQTLVLSDTEKAFEPYYIRVFSSGYLTASIKTVTRDVSGIVTTTNTPVSISAPFGNLHDGRWHHVAFVIDGDNKKVALYLDYSFIGSKPFLGELLCDGHVAIGDTPGQGYGKWAGMIDEVRFSDEALGSEQFLQLKGEYVDAADDVVMYQKFTPFPSWFGTENSGLFRNCISNDIEVVYYPNKGGSVVFTNDVPSPVVRQGIFTNTELGNNGSLLIKPNADNRSPYIGVDDIVDNQHSILTNSFSIEFFLKVPAKPEKYGYVVCLHGKSGAGSLLCQIDANGGLSTSMWKEESSARVSLGAKSDFADDQWHHVAITYDREKKKGSYYVDYRLVKSETFTFDPSVNETADYTKLLVFGNGYGDDRYGISAFIDEIRITTRALSPQEFVTKSEYVDVPYSAWMAFEDDFSVDPYPMETYGGVANARGGNPAPTLSRTSVPGEFLEDADGKRGRENKSSLNIDGGTLVYSRNLMIENLENQTVEFFMCGTSADDWANVVRLSASGNLSDPIWAIAFASATEMIDKPLLVRVDTKNAMNSNGANQTLTLKGVRLLDGRWHHVAITFRKTSETSTRITAWVDYKEATWLDADGTLARGDLTVSTLTFGGSTVSGASFYGNVDEFRITPSVLEPEEFIRRYKEGGTLLIIR